jgi:hypothetical protein
MIRWLEEGVVRRVEKGRRLMLKRDRKGPKRKTKVGKWVVAMADSGQKSTKEVDGERQR